MMINYKSNDNHFRIKKNGVINVYYLHQVNSIRLVKQRDFTLNIVTILSSVICYAIASFISEIFLPVLVISFLCSGLFLLFSINHKAHSYKIVLVTSEPRTIEFTANIFEIEDIEQMVSKIDRALTINHFSHAYSINEFSEAPDSKQKKTYEYQR